jgi:hypothetical protein
LTLTHLFKAVKDGNYPNLFFLSETFVFAICAHDTDSAGIKRQLFILFYIQFNAGFSLNLQFVEILMMSAEWVL